MELLKIFIKDEVPAVGLTKFKDKKEQKTCYLNDTGLKIQYFKPNYSKNFFLA